MNGRPDLHLKRLLLVTLLLGGCDPEAESPLTAQAVASASAVFIPPSIDISGCWREVDPRNTVQPLGAPFNFVKIAPNAFVFEINPSRTKLVVKQDLSFREQNLDENKPFFPRGTEFSSGSISQDNSQVNRTFTGEGVAHIYRRCEKVPNIPINSGLSNPLISSTPIPTPVPVITPLRPNGARPAASTTPRPTLTPLGSQTGGSIPASPSSLSGAEGSGTESSPPPTSGSPSFPFAGPLLPPPTPTPTPIPPQQEPPESALSL
ncbi:MAG: hypothetical protein AB7I41_07950 [Candidatus Sericytochromatia bacterium]